MTKITKKPRRRMGIYAGVSLVALLALIAAVVLSSGNNDSGGMPQDVAVTITGESLPAFAGDPNSDPGLGMTAPILSGQGFDGQTIAVTDDGRPKLILFLAHWCPHCQREVPAVQTYADEIGFPDSADVYSVSTSHSPSRPNWPPSAWFEREGWTFPVIVDDPESSAHQAYGQGAFPYYVFLDSAGRVALRLSGEQDPVALAQLIGQLAGF